MLIGGWGRGGFKLDLRQDCDSGRQDCDPGKQKLKGAVRTETYWRHYCQHISPRVFPMFSFSSFRFLVLTLRSMIHFEIIFV
jgi:hypothetical protein